MSNLAIALLVGFGVFALVYVVASGSSSGLGSGGSGDLLESRLAQFGASGRAVTYREVEMSLPFTERVFRPMLNRVGRVMARRTPQQAQQAIQDMINLAGHPWGINVGSFLTLRFFGLGIGLVVGAGFALLLGLSAAIALAAVFGFGIFGYLAPMMALRRKVKARKHEIQLSLPSALDLLTVSVEAGLGFDAAMGRIAEKYQNALAREFAQVLNEIRLGRQRAEALEDMARRCKVEDLHNFVQAIVQSEQLGVGIANVLRIQSEEMRRRRRQRAEEKGQQAPIKMLIPMVGCIFPTLFIILLGPAVVEVVNQFAAK